VLEEEILVAPGLEARVFVVAEGRQGVAAGAVEVHRIVLEAVDRREVHAAAEPADRRAACLRMRQRRDHAHVHVDGGHVRVARMEHQRHAHGFEGRARQFRPVLRGRGRQLRTANLREAAARALEQRAAFEDAGEAAAL